MDDDRIEELLPIVAELAEKYTGYESTSVTYEKAQALMEAVLFCLKEYDNSCRDGLAVRKIPAKKRYAVGLKLIAEKVENIRKIWNGLADCFDDYGVRCLYDTVQKGIPQFLKWYDIQFCPQDTILTLDYPVLWDCSSLTGADAVYEYMKAVSMEQVFLSAFNRNYIISVLEKYHSEYQDMVENICSIVLTNIIGHIAVRKAFDNTEFLHEEYVQLSKAFAGKSISDIECILKNLINNLVSQFYESDRNLFTYLCCEINNIAVRIYTANQHDQLRNAFML